MMATFSHTWINEQQYDDLGDIMYNCGGLRFGLKERGVMAPESDLTIAPDLTRATQMLWFTNFCREQNMASSPEMKNMMYIPLLDRIAFWTKSRFCKVGCGY